MPIVICFLFLFILKGPPVFIKKPVDQIGVSGGVASFVCQATGDPKPRVTWNKKGKKVNSQRFEVRRPSSHCVCRKGLTESGYCSFVAVLRPDNRRLGRKGVITAERVKYKLLATFTAEIVPKQQCSWVFFMLMVIFLLFCWLVV